MKNKIMIGIGIAAACVVVIAAAAVQSSKRNTADSAASGSEVSAASMTDETEATSGDAAAASDDAMTLSNVGSDTETPAAGSATEETADGTGSSTAAETGNGTGSNGNSAGETGSNGNTAAGGSSNGANTGNGTNGTNGTGGTGNSGNKSGSKSGSAETTVTLPVTVEEYGLTIESVKSYDGAFIEDGSDEEVSGIAIALVKNTGDQYIEYADITMTQDGQDLHFVFSTLSPGEEVAVMEQSRTAFTSDTFQSIEALAAVTEKFEMSAKKVSVTENSDGSLTVTNLTKKEIPCLRIFYKLYMEDEDVYVGGITYTVKLTELAAGSSMNVTPSHYQAGNSKIVMIRLYDSDN